MAQYSSFLENRMADSQWMHWRKPGCFKLVTRVNVQASTNKASAGGTIRDGNNGEWMLCFSKKLGETSGLESQLLALREGLLVAWERRLPRVEAEVYPEVIDAINNTESSEVNPLRGLIEECRALSRMPWEFSFSCPKNDATTFACTMAELGQYDLVDDFRLWEEPPVSFFTFLRQFIDESPHGN